MMTTGERLAGELRRAWCGSPWHGPSVREVLLRLTAQQAAFRRFRGSHTAWELLRHLTLWVEVPLRRFEDPTSVTTEEQNFAPPSATTENDWQRDIDALGEVVERLAARVECMTDAALEAPVGTRGYSHAFMVDGVVQHLAYHAGQIALLARPKEEVANLLAPAPLFPLGAILLAELANRFGYSLHVRFPALLGWALIVLGAALAFWAHQHFVARRTPAVPWKTPRDIVQSGPYRFTRNPMYLGFLLIMAGIGCVRDNALYLVLLLPTWAFLHWGVVLREEPFLLRKFGAPYQQLLHRTRRWL